MTRGCSLKEVFIENLLDEFQPGWRNGESIRAETKQQIKKYVSSKMPEELIEPNECITDYSIWNMAKKIRERENLPKPKRSNKGKKVSECKPCEEKTIMQSNTRNQIYFLRPRKEASANDLGSGAPSVSVSANASVHENLMAVLRHLVRQYGVNEFFRQ